MQPSVIRPAHIVAVLFLATLLASCKSASVADDPVRAEFVAACIGRVEYRSMETARRTAFCKCGYDRTMSGLSDNEKPYARFYLLSQVSVDVRERNLITRPDMQAMIKASKAIGGAVRQCG